MRRLAFLVAVFALGAPVGQASAAKSIAQSPIRTVRAGQGTIGYRTVGTGRPLVLIMGLSGTMDAWSPKFVDALARHRRVIAFDNEGIGASTLGPGTLSIRRMGDDTASLIRALHLGRADVLGWSMGGMVAQALTRRHPTLVRRLVLCATAPGDGHATSPTPDALSALNGSDPGATLGLLFAPGHDADVAAYIGDITRYPSFRPMAPPAVSRAQLAASTVWVRGRDPVGRPLSALRLPVLVGGGQRDRLLPVANDRHLAAKLPNARLRVYGDSAHGFLFQHRVDFVRQIDRFLS